MCCRAVRLWRGFAGCGRLPQHPLWCGEFRLRINAGFRPPCSLRERQSRKRGLLSAGALCRGGRAGRFYHDTKRRSHPPAVRYYHFIAALFSITAEKCKDFFCLFPPYFVHPLHCFFQKEIQFFILCFRYFQQIYTCCHPDFLFHPARRQSKSCRNFHCGSFPLFLFCSNCEM